jgi:hypothetical protein
MPSPVRVTNTIPYKASGGYLSGSLKSETFVAAKCCSPGHGSYRIYHQHAGRLKILPKPLFRGVWLG